MASEVERGGRIWEGRLAMGKRTSERSLIYKFATAPLVELTANIYNTVMLTSWLTDN